MTDITIEELLEDYRYKYSHSDGDEKSYYIEKTKEVIEYLMLGRFDVLPFREEDGKCDYRLRVRSP